MGAEWGLFGEVAISAKGAVDLVGGHLMEALARAPLWVTLAVAPGDPGLAGSVKQVLSTQDVDAQEELRVLSAAKLTT